jgi:hypothetical protein
MATDNIVILLDNFSFRARKNTLACFMSPTEHWWTFGNELRINDKSVTFQRNYLCYNVFT